LHAFSSIPGLVGMRVTNLSTLIFIAQVGEPSYILFISLMKERTIKGKSEKREEEGG
jgi:hypothetical protein